MNSSKRTMLAWIAAAVAASAAAPALAVDGVVLIDQNKALAGNVTFGDAPGFPVTIRASGSYRLSGNLTVPEQVTGIEINANNVTLDLNGFSIVGPVVCTLPNYTGTVRTLSCNPGQSPTPNYGIFSAANNITVQNGTVQGMNGAGVALTGNAGVVRDVIASSNPFYGILLSTGMVTRSTAMLNGSGISAVLISDSIAHSNGDYGFAIGPGGLLTRSTAHLNAREALYCNGPSDGYSNNVFRSNALGDPAQRQVYFSCTDLGQNLCDGHACP